MKSIHLILALLVTFLYSGASLAQSRVGAWQVHDGTEGIVSFQTRTDEQRKEALGKGTIPAKLDAGWKLANTNKYGTVSFSKPSVIKSCAQQLDFTYFQTTVYVPANMNLAMFTVTYDVADDGARVYFFNSKYPKGHYEEASDLIRNASSHKAVNLKDQIVKGEDNCIVIVQYDQCAPGNNISGIRIKMDGKEVTPTVLPDKFRLHAYSINGKRVEKGSDYWMGYDKNAQKKNAGDGNKAYYEGKIGSPKNATVMEFEKVDVDREKGIIALKLIDSPVSDLYL